MRIVFMGTPRYAATILANLMEQHEVVCAYSRPDAISGRGKVAVPSPVSSMAHDAGIEVRTPLTLAEEVAHIAELAPDAICCAAFGLIIPKEVLSIPPSGCLNVHASILPAWRGAAPVERAILAGDDEAGVCIMRMEEGLDTGDYCIVRTTEIGGKSAVELTAELAELGSAALLSALAQIEGGSIEWTAQDDFFATYAHKIGKRELFPRAEDTALLAVRKVQASSPAHPARVFIGERGCTITGAQRVVSRLEREELALVPGSARFARKKLYLGMADQPIQVLSIKPDGKREMDAASFAAGMPQLKDGTAWRCADE